MAKDRGRRDGAGIGPDPEYSTRLYPIDELDGFKVAAGEPDIRGWSVCTLNGREVGEVDDLLVDPARNEVVMIEIDVERSGRHVEVPIRSLQLDRERKCVVVDSGDLADMGTVHDVKRRERLTEDDRQLLRDDTLDMRGGDVRYDAAGATDEVVIERRPVVEEVVVRRRVVGEERAADELE